MPPRKNPQLTAKSEQDIRLGSFNSYGASFTAGCKTVLFTENQGYKVYNLFFSKSGVLEFDYRDKHYTYQLDFEAEITLGGDTPIIEESNLLLS